jgi:hypothetical protein
MTEARAAADGPARVIAIMLAIAVSGLALVVAGIWVLFGLGCGLVASGLALLAIAAVLRRGVLRSA